MQREATKKDEYKRHPRDGLEQRGNELHVLETVPQHGESDGRHVKDNHARDPNLPGCDVEMIKGIGEEPEDEIVDDCEQEAGGDGVVGPYVGENGDFRGHGHGGKNELEKGACERTPVRPFIQRMEHELVAAVGILLPSGKFVVQGK